MPATTSSRATTFTLPSDREIAFTRVFNAPCRLVYDAWTNPTHLPHWLLGPKGWTMPVCEVDLRPGGAYRFVWRGPDGTDMGLRGVYQEIKAPERLVAKEAFDDFPGETLNTLVFSEKDGKTTIRATILYPSKEARDAVLQSGMRDGLSESLDRLAEHLPTMA